MIYLFGVNIPSNKYLRTGLTYIYGINNKNANAICNQLGFDKSFKTYQLTNLEISKITKLVEQAYLIESELKKDILNNVKRLMMINCYKGIRHRLGLPINGQRTHTNAKTQRRIGKRFIIK